MYIIKAHTQKAKIEKGTGDLNIMQKTGNVIAADIEPTDICFVIHTATAKTAKAKAVGAGRKAIKTPAEVATPLPPLKFKNIVQIWPAIPAAATSIMKR